MHTRSLASLLVSLLLSSSPPLPILADLLNASGRQVLIESCHPLGSDQAPTINPVSGELDCPFHYFRTSADVTFSIDSVLGNALTLTRVESISRPTCWGHPDMLQVGNLWSYEEDRLNFALWCIMSAPLILSFDLNNTVQLMKALPVITNEELIAINQEWAGHPGRLVVDHRSEDKAMYIAAEEVRRRVDILTHSV